MGGLYSELKRRNVIKVGIAYAVVAWLLVQIVVSIEAPLRLPDWVDSLTIVLLGVGFPVALVMAWALDLTPEGIKLSTTEAVPKSIAGTPKRTLDFVIIAALGLAVAVLLLDRFGPRTGNSVAGASLAVLPFTDLSPSGDQEYFSDGIAEELLNRLNKLQGLQVAGRTSSFHFKDREEDLRAIGEQLGVANILEGSVRKAGDRVRIAVQLIKAADGFQIWSDSYDRELTDIFAIQEDIARSVADALSVTLGVGDKRFGAIGTRNFDAYDAALKGRALMLKRVPDSTDRSIALFREAVTLDPDYAYAWSLLANSYVEAGSIWQTDRASEFFDLAYQAATRAIEVSPDSPDSLRAMSVVQVRRFQWALAESNLQRALEKAPMDVISNMTYGWFLMNVGDPLGSLPYLERALELDPLAASLPGMLSMLYREIGEYDRATSEFERWRTLIGNSDIVLGGELVLAMEQEASAMIEASLDKFLELPGGPADSQTLTMRMRDLLDQPDEAISELRSYVEDVEGRTPFEKSVVTIYASYFGDDDLTLRLFFELQKVEALSGELLWQPIYAGVRRLPGFKDLLRDRALVDYWRQSGHWGDFCRPLGDEEFECK